MSKIKSWTKENSTTLLLIIGIFFGLLCGFALKTSITVSPLALTYIGLPGKVIIRSFMMVIVPLIITSLSTSITSTKRGENKRLIIISFALIVIFMIFVSVFATVLVTVIKPGSNSDTNTDINSNGSEILQNKPDIKQMISSQEDAIHDVFINMVPDNIIAATFMTHYTALVPLNPQNLSLGYKKVTEKSFNPNMLGLCTFSLILGFSILHLGEKAHTIKTVLDETNLIMMNLLQLMIKIMPIAMFSWMFVEAIKMKSPEKILIHLGWFVGTTFFAFAILWLLIYPGIYLLIVRKNPYKIYYNIIPAMIIAFGSSSSAITLPVTMRCMENKNNLAQPISHFFLPLGMTMHMPGAAMYYPMVAVFVAQMQGMNVTLAQIITLCIYSVIQAMAFPGAPSGGSDAVYFIATCASIGIENPMEIIAYISSIDWFMERVKTVTNITGDCILAPIVEKFCHMKTDGQIDTTKVIKSSL